MTTKISSFVKKLARTNTGDVLFNPYNELSKISDDGTAPGIRQRNIRLYLDTYKKLDSKVLWVYHTPTFKELKRSGVPLANSSVFTQIEGILDTSRRFEKATKKSVISSSTAISTIFWNISEELKINPLIWPVIPFYPHKKDAVSVKRNPTNDEIIEHRWFIDKIIEIFNPKTIIGVGKDTENALELLEIKAKIAPHPRRGKKAFKALVKKYH